MKKSILSAIAVGVFAIGGAAQADLIDNVGSTLSRIFGVPYDPRPLPQATAPAPVGNGLYTDAYGRHYQLDAYGRYVPLGQFGSYRDSWGRTVYLGANRQPAYIDQDGRLIPYRGTADSYASYDRDGDGVNNAYDRFPNDPRYR